MSSARARFALCEVRGPGPSPPRLLLYRRALRLHIEWEAELPWQSLQMVVTHEGRADAPPRAVNVAPSALGAPRRADVGRLARGLPLYGLEAVDVALDPPSEGAGCTTRVLLCVPGRCRPRRRGTCAACWGQPAHPSVRQDAYLVDDARGALGAGVRRWCARGCMHRRWRRRRVGRRSRCGPRRCGRRRRAAAALGRRCSPPPRRSPPRAAVAVARRVAAQGDRSARRHRPPPSPRRASPTAAARHRRGRRRRRRRRPRCRRRRRRRQRRCRASASAEGRKGCRCASRPRWVPRARLGHGGGPALWGGIALVKYRLLASLPLGARLLSLRALRTDGSSLPPCVCVLPAAGADGGIAPVACRARRRRARHRQLRVVLGERLRGSRSPPPTAQAPLRWRGRRARARWRRRCRRRRSS